MVSDELICPICGGDLEEVDEECLVCSGCKEVFQN